MWRKTVLESGEDRGDIKRIPAILNPRAEESHVAGVVGPCALVVQTIPTVDCQGGSAVGKIPRNNPAATRMSISGHQKCGRVGVVSTFAVIWCTAPFSLDDSDRGAVPVLPASPVLGVGNERQLEL